MYMYICIHKYTEALHMSLWAHIYHSTYTCMLSCKCTFSPHVRTCTLYMYILRTCTVHAHVYMYIHKSTCTCCEFLQKNCDCVMNTYECPLTATYISSSLPTLPGSRNPSSSVSFPRSPRSSGSSNREGEQHPQGLRAITLSRVPIVRATHIIHMITLAKTRGPSR